MEDTIAAISTPPGTGAVAMIRISGPDSWRVAQRLTGLENPEPRKVYLSTLRDEEGVVDEVMVVFYRSPKSYTGEDMVEITCHGGYTVTKMVLEAVLRSGARLASPGEFTKRAFLNGKMDLTSAEAVNELIEARSEEEVRNFIRNVRGELFNEMESFRKILIEILSEIEVEIDYPDEVDIDSSNIAERLEKLISRMNDILENAERSVRILHGISLVIVGKPNVGKSTLLNLLVREDRAIVTPIPGTTRDVIKAELNVGGYHFVVSDTAGIRETEDPIERMGVEKALKEIENADIVLFVLDASNVDDEDRGIYESIGNKRKIVVINKIDLVERIEIPEWLTEKPVEMVATLGEGLKDLERAFIESVRKDYESLKSKVVFTSERQIILLRSAKDELENALESIHTGFPNDLISLNIMKSLEYLDEITGRRFREDLLDTIFSRFCVGK